MAFLYAQSAIELQHLVLTRSVRWAYTSSHARLAIFDPAAILLAVTLLAKYGIRHSFLHVARYFLNASSQRGKIYVSCVPSPLL